ncbi:hypothetical protein R3W88_031735 [Solanum pinnatisectum]|uniref:Uncharacterized protein n=1 Tax=Solanum pinnatisectum TaxID=50273 RepID=A0AAV9LMJ0_9SOLN|nr:hypothetical protein R3W88_031735 [Solanum pinnatisectum]
MEKAEEKIGTSNVENENAELNLGLSLNGGSQGSVASSVAEVETQQPPTQVEFVEHAGGGYVENPLNHIFIAGKQIKQHYY